MDTILLVEDTEDIMEINEWYLTQRGFRTLKAYNLAQAREQLRKNHFDLLILDVLLPDGNGLDFCEEIRKEYTMPILFLTGMVTDRDIMAGYRNGGNDYITKPYDLDMLGVRVESLIAYARGIGSKIQEQVFGPLRFNLVQSAAFVGDTPLCLSGAEYGILYYLARHNTETVSKETLFREVWGVNSGTEGPMLWTTVSRLKKKISQYMDLFYIDSDHSGYRLVLPRTGREDKR